jgi:hypothetical protein
VAVACEACSSRGLAALDRVGQVKLLSASVSATPAGPLVRIRYFGLFANRHREQSLALCREVLPSRPVQPKLTKSDWQSLLQSLTGVDPLRCEICGQKALRLVEELAPAQAPRAPPR